MKTLGGLLELSEMFRDDLWWNMPDEEDVKIQTVPVVSQQRIEVIPNPNPMVLKAEQIFREALTK
jgi:hypothetical protein